MSTAPARHAQVDGRDIWVFDGLVDRVGVMAEALNRATFARTERATIETSQYRHWVREMDLRTLASLPLHQATLSAIESAIPQRPYRAYRAYTNYAGYGDVLLIHTDCQPDADEYTALWFLADEWDADWGGETLFFDRHRDARCVVSPKPGRLVLFHGAIAHAGRPPTRICYAPRYTFAIKLEPVPQSEQPR